jgi:hypothetical protein
MSRKNTLVEIWNTYTTNVLNESAPGKQAAKFGKNKGRGPVELNDKRASQMQNATSSGPENAENFNKDIIDPKKKKRKKDELYNSSNFSSENFDKNLEKKAMESINNNMKSVFDKLFEEVMNNDSDDQELGALGIGDDEGDDTDTDEGSDEVTLTLDRATAQKICDMLQSQLGGDEGEDEGDDDTGDLGDDEADSEEDFEYFGYDESEEDEGMDEEEDDMVPEGIDIQELSPEHGRSLMHGKKNKVGNSNVHPSKGKGVGKIKKQHDPEGSELPSSAGHKLTSRQNKVGGTKTSKPGGSFFA